MKKNSPKYVRDLKHFPNDSWINLNKFVTLTVVICGMSCNQRHGKIEKTEIISIIGYKITSSILNQEIFINIEKVRNFEFYFFFSKCIINAILSRTKYNMREIINIKIDRRSFLYFYLQRDRDRD